MFTSVSKQKNYSLLIAIRITDENKVTKSETINVKKYERVLDRSQELGRYDDWQLQGTEYIRRPKLLSATLKRAVSRNVVKHSQS